MTKITATAPGKLVLFGEYAVLEGAPALVMATSNRARATFEVAEASQPPAWRIDAPTLGLQLTLHVHDGQLRVADAGAMPKALGLAVALVQDVWQHSRGALPPGRLTLDTQAFYSGSLKLGMGSSGAIAVAAWHALAQAAGIATLGPQATVAHLRALHSAQQGGVGSGVDLAASLMGGIVRYQLAQSSSLYPEVVGPLSATHVRDLPELHILPMWTGRPAATGPFVQAFEQLKKDAPQVFWRSCEEMALISRAACELWALGEVTPLLPLVTRATTAMETLGQALGLDLVTDVHREAARAAAAAGVVYKPSGAGGGDFGLLFAQSARSLNKASRALAAQGLKPMPTPPGSPMRCQAPE